MIQRFLRKLCESLDCCRRMEARYYEGYADGWNAAVQNMKDAKQRSKDERE